MQSDAFNSLSSAVGLLFGNGEPLPSGNGTRFRCRGRGRVTVHHEPIAVGNQAEIAFESGSIAQSVHRQDGEIRALIATWRQSTARKINFNGHYRWPRVGIATPQHMEFIVGALRQTDATTL